jgi:hypothetical protein
MSCAASRPPMKGEFDHAPRHTNAAFGSGGGHRRSVHGPHRRWTLEPMERRPNPGDQKRTDRGALAGGSGRRPDQRARQPSGRPQPGRIDQTGPDRGERRGIAARQSRVARLHRQPSAVLARRQEHRHVVRAGGRRSHLYRRSRLFRLDPGGPARRHRRQSGARPHHRQLGDHGRARRQRSVRAAGGHHRRRHPDRALSDRAHGA